MELKKNYIYEVVILVLAVAVTFFATRTYRNETVLRQQQQLIQYQALYQETNKMLNQIDWNPQSVKLWENLGYRLVPKVPAVK